MVANFVGDVLFREKGLQGLMDELDTSESRNILSYLKEFVQKIKALFTKSTMPKEITELEKMFAKNLLQAGGERDGNSYSLLESAKEEIELITKNKNYRNEVKLSETTPQILVGQNDVKNYPITMNASHIRTNILTEQQARDLGITIHENDHYHGLGKELFYEIINSLDNVTEAYRGTKNASDSSRREKYFLLILNLKDDDGNTINAPIYINEKSKVNNAFIDANKMATSYGKIGLRDFIQKEIKKGNLIRIKKKSNGTSEWTGLIPGDYSSIASTDSIDQNSENVKRKFSLYEKPFYGNAPYFDEYRFHFFRVNTTTDVVHRFD